MSITDIVTKIDQRLHQIQVEQTQLTNARAALVKVAGSQPSARQQAKSKRRRPARETTEAVPWGKVAARLAESGGQRTKELAAFTNGNSEQILTLLKEQEEAELVRRTGERAATRWRLITDEDRVAARAKELEAAQSAHAG